MYRVAFVFFLYCSNSCSLSGGQSCCSLLLFLLITVFSSVVPMSSSSKILNIFYIEIRSSIANKCLHLTGIVEPVLRTLFAVTVTRTILRKAVWCLSMLALEFGP